MRAAILFMFLSSGCGIVKIPTHISPFVALSDTGAVEVSGDAKLPAKVDTKNTNSVLLIPQGSRFEFNEKAGVLALQLSKATQMAVNRTETAIIGPVAFEPDKAPTVKEVADAKADYWTILGLRGAVFMGIAAALFGLIRGWDLVMYGGAVVAAGGLFGIFVEKHPVLLAVIGVGVAVAVAGPYIWHTKLKHISDDELP